jgi:hypothetical protein
MHAEHWRPSSFRAPPQPADEAGEEPAPSLTIHRL